MTATHKVTTRVNRTSTMSPIHGTCWSAVHGTQLPWPGPSDRTAAIRPTPPNSSSLRSRCHATAPTTATANTPAPR